MAQASHFRECVCLPLICETQPFLKRRPSRAGQRPQPVFLLALAAGNHSEFGLVTSEARHTFLSHVKCLPVHASLSFLWWVVTLFLDLGGSVHVLVPNPLLVLCVTHAFCLAAAFPLPDGPCVARGLPLPVQPGPSVWSRPESGPGPSVLPCLQACVHLCICSLSERLVFFLHLCSQCIFFMFSLCL